MMMELGIEPRALYLPFWVGGKNSSKGILRRLPPMEKPTHNKRGTKDNGRYDMPSMTDWAARHQAVTKELAELFAAKNEDYGDSFHRTFLEEGVAAARVRLTDKLNRFKVLTKGKAANVKDESVRDTLLDLANYAIMTVMELDEPEARHEPDKAATVLSDKERAIASVLGADYVTRDEGAFLDATVEFWIGGNYPEKHDVGSGCMRYFPTEIEKEEGEYVIDTASIARIDAGCLETHLAPGDCVRLKREIGERDEREVHTD